MIIRIEKWEISYLGMDKFFDFVVGVIDVVDDDDENIFCCI